MKDQKMLRMSKQDLARTQVVEFGKILFNLQIVAAFVFASPFPFAIFPIYYGALIILSLFSGFTIYALIPNFGSLWNPTKIYNATFSLVEAWKFSVPIVAALSLLTILCLRFDKNDKHKIRVFATIALIAILVIYYIFRLSIINAGGVNQ